MKVGTVILVVAALGAGVTYRDQILRLLPNSVAEILGGPTTDPVATVVGSVQRLNDMRVFRAQVVSIRQANVPGSWILPDSKVNVVVPGYANYIINLSKINRESLNWDKETGRLIAVVPDPIPSDINIDGSQASVLVDGCDFMSGDRREEVLKLSLKDAKAEMARKARGEFLMTTAKDAGRAALKQVFEAPLVAAGFKPTVVIRFQSEASLPALTKG